MMATAKKDSKRTKEEPEMFNLCPGCNHVVSVHPVTIEPMEYDSSGSAIKVATCPNCGSQFVAADGFRITYQRRVLLTQEDVDDIMSSALDGGISYWCSGVEVIGDYLGEYASEQISRGGVLRLHTVDGDWTELNLEFFVNGFRKWLERGYDQYGAVEGGKVDPGMIDAEAADAIIQLACYGEVIFG